MNMNSGELLISWSKWLRYFLRGWIPKGLLLLGGVLVVYGCTTMYDATESTRQSLLYLSIGMDRRQVEAIMGSQTYRVYTPRPLTICGFDPEIGDTYLMSKRTFTTITNPFERRVMTVNGKTYDVDYYVTGSGAGESEVTDDDLTPLLYENEILIGWGWEFLCELYRNEQENEALFQESVE